MVFLHIKLHSEGQMVKRQAHARKRVSAHKDGRGWSN